MSTTKVKETHELNIKYLKANREWLGTCSCQRFSIGVPADDSKKPPEIIESNYELHRKHYH